MHTPKQIGTSGVRAAVASGPGSRLSIVSVELGNLADHDVLIEYRAAGVCGSDLAQVQGSKAGVLFPLLPGHEGAGVVLEVGKAVTDLARGDHVVVCALGECGTCASCKSPRTNMCEVAGVQGLTAAHRYSAHFQWDKRQVAVGSPCATFATHSICDQAHVTRIPREVPFDVASLLSCAVMTGVGSAINVARVTPGSTVVVFGLGGVGLNVVDGAQLAGASRIVGIDTNPQKQAIGIQFGMTDFVCSAGNERVVEEVRELLRGGADFAFDCTGLKPVIQQSIAVTRPDCGVVTLVGIPADPNLGLSARDILSGRTLTGAYFGKTKGRSGIRQLADWLVAGKLHSDKLVSHRFSLDRINEAFDLLQTGRCIRSVVMHGG